VNDLAGYYARRAAEYDAVYDKPERQPDLARLRELTAGLVSGRRVLEIAAGTGYWTQVMSGAAASVTATDLSDETLAIARARSCGPAPVTFRIADAFTLDAVSGEFDAAFIGFFWSHISRGDVPRFLRGLAARLRPGARIVVIDNRYVHGSSTPITAVTAAGDTYQRRVLRDGRQYEILKNFPSRGQFGADVAAVATGLRWTSLRHFWLAECAVR
jgi:ubiquinone/menaquinone biosynthesis C-methylase UbiE